MVSEHKMCYGPLRNMRVLHAHIYILRCSWSKAKTPQLCIFNNQKRDKFVNLQADLKVGSNVKLILFAYYREC
jgi:hypothetical protein